MNGIRRAFDETTAIRAVLPLPRVIKSHREGNIATSHASRTHETMKLWTYDTEKNVYAVYVF